MAMNVVGTPYRVLAFFSDATQVQFGVESVIG